MRVKKKVKVEVCCKMVDRKDLDVIVQKFGLSVEEAKFFIGIIEKRFSSEFVTFDYACEWALRVQKGTAFFCGDSKTKNVLKDLGWVEA